MPMPRKSPDTSYREREIDLGPNNINLISRTALAVVLSLCCAKDVYAAKKADSSKFIPNTDLNSISDKGDEKVQLKKVDINETIDSTNVILRQVSSVKIIYNKLKANQQLSAFERNNLVDIAKAAGLSSVSKIEEIFKKEKFTSEEVEFLLDQIKLIAIFQRDKILSQRNLIIALYSALQLDGSAGKRVTLEKIGEYLWTLNAVIRQMNKDYGLE